MSAWSIIVEAVAAVANLNPEHRASLLDATSSGGDGEEPPPAGR